MNTNFPSAAFWSVFEDRHPQERSRREKKAALYWQRGMREHSLVLSMFIAPDRNDVGVFLGENAKIGAVDIARRLGPHCSELYARIPLREEHQRIPFPFRTVWQIDCWNEENWPAMADWLVTTASRYERTLNDVLGRR